MAFRVKRRNFLGTKHMKSIGLMLLLTVTMVIMAFLYMQNFHSSMQEESNLTLNELSAQSTSLLNRQVRYDLKTLSSIAAVLGQDETWDMNAAMETLKLEKAQKGSEHLLLITPDGTAYGVNGNTYNFGGQEFFQKALNGESNITSTLFEMLDDQPMIVYAVPVQQENKVVGVLAVANYPSDYGDTLKLETFDGKGYGHIIVSDGTVVIPSNNEAANPHIRSVFDEDFNSQTEITQLETDMKAGRRGIVSHLINGTNSFITYTPTGVNNWYLWSVIPKSSVRPIAVKMIRSAYYACFVIIISFVLLFSFFHYVLIKNRRILERLAYVDPITGLSNWNKFKRDSAGLLKQHINRKYAYVAISIDKFEIISDIYGIEKSNWILCVIAKELDRILQPNESFARRSNDSFGALLTYTDFEELTGRLTALNQKISSLIPDSNVSLKCGIFEITDKTMPIGIISDRAVLAQQTILSGSGVIFAFYNEDIRHRMIAEKEIENYMEGALANHEFQLYLQPKYDFQSEKIVGAEALVRWTLEDGKMLFPDDFIPIFEKDGFILRLDLYMFEAVCGTLRSMLDRKMDVVPISVNVSRLHIYDSNFVSGYVAVFQKYNLPPNLIELEMTENIYLEDVKLLNSIIERFHKVGFLLSMDDFGSGYSSLNMLKDSTIDIIKIDKEFLRDMSDNPRNKYIIESVIHMCKQLGLQVVAEGVETAAQVEFLRAIHCDMAQGYYYAKPMTTSCFETLLPQK